METFSVVLRIIRMCMVKGVKILLITFIQTDFFEHNLMKFLQYCCCTSNYRDYILWTPWFLEFVLHSYLSRTFCSLQSSHKAPSQQITPTLNLEGKGESAPAIIVFSGWERGRGSQELLAAAAEGAGWAELWVTNSLEWGRAEHFLPGQPHCCDPAPSPAAYFQEMWAGAGWTLSQQLEEMQ